MGNGNCQPLAHGLLQGIQEVTFPFHVPSFEDRQEGVFYVFPALSIHSHTFHLRKYEKRLNITVRVMDGRRSEMDLPGIGGRGVFL